MAAASAMLAPGAKEAKEQQAQTIPERTVRPAPAAPRYRSRRAQGNIYARNGERETTRRSRQIAAGQLTRSNGLVA